MIDSGLLVSQKLSFENIAKKLHIKERYSKLPLDAVDEIVELCECKHFSTTRSKLDIVVAYFEHAITCKVVKKFDLTNKQKQLLFTSIQFLDLFLDDAEKKYKDVNMLHDVLTRIATRHHEDIETQITYAYKQFEKITKGKDLMCNHLILSSTLAVFFAKDADIDKKLKDKIIKLANKIHDDVEKTEGNTIMYTNAAAICGEFYKNTEIINIKKG
mgnify:CR=1 FL=1